MTEYFPLASHLFYFIHGPALSQNCIYVKITYIHTYERKCTHAYVSKFLKDFKNLGKTGTVSTGLLQQKHKNVIESIRQRKIMAPER